MGDPEVRLSHRENAGNLTTTTVQTDSVDEHCIFFTLHRSAFHLNFLASLRYYFVLVSDFVDLTVIVNQDNVSAFIGAAPVTGRLARVPCNALRVTKPPGHIVRFAHIVGIQRDC
jgi:hypothetical protein